jgi:hypothetical protein
MEAKETKHVIGFRESKLKPGETVVGHLEGWIGEMMGKGDKTQHNGQFILTNMRACFYRKGFLGEVFETIPLEKVTSVETLSRMGYRVLRLHTSHNELSFKTFESAEFFDQVYESLEASRDRSMPLSQTAASTASIPQQIKELAELRNAGILSEEEFATKKAQLLEKL